MEINRRHEGVGQHGVTGRENGYKRWPDRVCVPISDCQKGGESRAILLPRLPHTRWVFERDSKPARIEPASRGVCREYIFAT